MTALDERVFVTFMRHARSLADDEGKYEGRYDAPLTEAGRQLVLKRANLWLADQVHFDLIITSTLSRAQTSAAMIGDLLQVPVELDSLWMEFNNGPIAGLPFEEAETRYPISTFRNPYQPFLGTGESGWDIHRRASQAVENVIRRGPGAYLVVAHGGILNVALRCITGSQIPVNGQGVWFVFKDTGYLQASYHPGRHEWCILEFNPGYE